MRKFILLLMLFFAAGCCSMLFFLSGCGSDIRNAEAGPEKKYRFTREGALDSSGNHAVIYIDSQTGRKYLAIYHGGVIEIEK